MGVNSSIEWTESTWNPVTGCSKISAGCMNCYAERMSKRLKAMGQKNYRNGFEVTLHHHALDLPLKWKKSQTIFVNSMSDLFHKDIPADFIQKVFETMKKSYWHKFQVLTKRADRLAQLAPNLEWPENVWMGVTVENNDHIDRIELLRLVPASVKFLSIEPLIGPIPNMDLCDIDWVIVGGESGPGSRPLEKEWVENIQKQCTFFNVPFFFKQWGGANKKKAGRILNGKTFSQMPRKDKRGLIASIY